MKHRPFASRQCRMLLRRRLGTEDRGPWHRHGNKVPRGPKGVRVDSSSPPPSPGLGSPTVLDWTVPLVGPKSTVPARKFSALGAPPCDWLPRVGLRVGDPLRRCHRGCCCGAGPFPPVLALRSSSGTGLCPETFCSAASATALERCTPINSVPGRAMPRCIVVSALSL